MADYSAPKEITDLVKRGALFVINHSGGKDSQAMTIKLRRLVPASQLLVIHADLPGVDWDGCWELVTDTCKDLETVQVVAGKTFFEMVERRGMFPSPKYRQCTSDLKRDPIEKTIRHWIKDHELDGLVVNCMGIRAEESSGRAKAKAFKFNKRNSKAGREWYDWLPIHNWLEGEVYAEILNAGEAVHWAYHMGMERLSCQFCIMASVKDLQVAATLAPENYKKIVDLEKKINYTMIMPKKGQDPRFLEEITGIIAN
jgi:3'-phosphoadenosine 5'-phosphosulfate sulfotransferase (PAPS reductase)/FAD synthetase